MSIFEKYLTVWVAAAIGLGLVVGNLVPGWFETLAGYEVASINLPIAVLIWLMIYPMMLGVDFGSVAKVHERPRGLIVTLAVNWLIKPLTMAGIAVVCMRYLFGGMIEPAAADEYIAGMILLGVAPCTAMVFVWSRLTDGDPNYTLVQVAVNDLIMVFAFAPIAALLLGVTDVTVPWDTLILSVVLFVVVPLVAGWVTRAAVRGADRIARIDRAMKPFSIVGLLATVFLLFGFQAQRVVEDPLLIALIAVPLTVQTYLVFAVAFFWMKGWRQPHSIAAPGAMIGASNFFELAVAVAISLFGLESGAALATVVGVLVEVPVMLSLVAIANRSRAAFGGDR
ncbi:MAG: ACR3 family arsenite efflux transporter [Planctomycetota bacterium]